MEDATVYVVDDIEVNRELIIRLMKTVQLPTVSFASAQDFLDVYEPGLPGCLVLDLRMPGMSGIELQRQLIDQDMRIPIIFVTAHSDTHIAVQAMKAGAFDFIQKPINPQQILDLVYVALAESRRIIAEQNEVGTINNHVASLTPREREVLQMVVNGEANKSIAYALDISERTVEVHRSRVMEKMQTPSLASLVKMTMRVNFGQKIS